MARNDTIDKPETRKILVPLHTHDEEPFLEWCPDTVIFEEVDEILDNLIDYEEFWEHESDALESYEAITSLSHEAANKYLRGKYEMACWNAVWEKTEKDYTFLVRCWRDFAQELDKVLVGINPEGWWKVWAVLPGKTGRRTFQAFTASMFLKRVFPLLGKPEDDSFFPGITRTFFIYDSTNECEEWGLCIELKDLVLWVDPITAPYMGTILTTEGKDGSSTENVQAKNPALSSNGGD